MMKSAYTYIVKVVLSIILLTWMFLPCGCAWDQLGETAAEGSRRHQRVLRINRQQMIEDLDKVLLLDQPSKLTEKRIP